MEEEEETVGQELDAADLLDPNPDILGLFCHYNDIYFDSKLHACTVDWSTNRMTLCAGICKYAKGSCVIRLSEPILKFRSSAELKETLLHEMIHAYLWLTNSNKDHDDHGPCFQEKMQAINNSKAVDHQRPERGYRISIYHNFTEEVNSYRCHQWKCTCCGDLIKRACNRTPSQSDCFQKSVRGSACHYARCHWHNHQQQCGGEYEKIAEPEGYKDKRPKSRRAGKEDAAGSNKPSSQTAKKKKPAVNNIDGDKSRDEGEDTPVRICKNASLEMFFSAKKDYAREDPEIATKIEDVGYICSDNPSEEDMAGKSPKRRREYKDDETEEEAVSTKMDEGSTAVLSKRQDGTYEFQKGSEWQNECTVIIGWKGWYAFEGEEDEKNMKALDNKRSQRRMFEKACCPLQHSCNVESDAESLRFCASKGPVSQERKMIKFKDIEAVNENIISPLKVSPLESFAKDSEDLSVSGTRGPLLEEGFSGSSISLSPPPLQSRAVMRDLGMLNYKEVAGNSSFVHVIRKEEILVEPGDSAIVPSYQEMLSSVSAQESDAKVVWTSMTDNGAYITEVEGNNEVSKLVNVHEGNHEMHDNEARSGKDLRIDGVATMGGAAGGVRGAKTWKTKAMRDGRLKRSREIKGHMNDSSASGGPSAACPICQEILPGDIEDANFNTKFNQHIDACMNSQLGGLD